MIGSSRSDVDEAHCRLGSDVLCPPCVCLSPGLCAEAGGLHVPPTGLAKQLLRQLCYAGGLPDRVRLYAPYEPPPRCLCLESSCNSLVIVANYCVWTTQTATEGSSHAGLQFREQALSSASHRPHLRLDIQQQEPVTFAQTNIQLLFTSTDRQQTRPKWSFWHFEAPSSVFISAFWQG